MSNLSGYTPQQIMAMGQEAGLLIDKNRPLIDQCIQTFNNVDRDMTAYYNSLTFKRLDNTFTAALNAAQIPSEFLYTIKDMAYGNIEVIMKTSNSLVEYESKFIENINKAIEETKALID